MEKPRINPFVRLALSGAGTRVADLQLRLSQHFDSPKSHCLSTCLFCAVRQGAFSPPRLAYREYIRSVSIAVSSLAVPAPTPRLISERATSDGRRIKTGDQAPVVQHGDLCRRGSLYGV